MEEIENVINASSNYNTAKIFPSKRFKELRDPLDKLFNNVTDISQRQCFWFSKNWKGSVKVRDTSTSDFVELKLSRENIESFIFEPNTLVAPGLKLIKQKELYTKVRQFVPDLYKNILCPMPGVITETTVSNVVENNEIIVQNPGLRRLVTEEELAKLMQVFNVNPTPNKTIVENLAFELEWSVKRIRTWFTNKKRTLK